MVVGACSRCAVLNEQFRKNLTVPTSFNGCGGTCQKAHTSAAICVKCFRTKNTHQYNGSNHEYCDYRNGNYQRGSFFTSTPTVLKTAKMTEEEITKSFKVGADSDKDKLKKFLEFVDA